MKKDEIKLWDLVRYKNPHSEGYGEGYMIGYPGYAADAKNVIVIATEKTIGMPIGIDWCEPTGERSQATGVRLRLRYEKEHPDFLAPTPGQAQHKRRLN